MIQSCAGLGVHYQTCQYLTAETWQNPLVNIPLQILQLGYKCWHTIAARWGSTKISAVAKPFSLHLAHLCISPIKLVPLTTSHLQKSHATEISAVCAPGIGFSCFCNKLLLTSFENSRITSITTFFQACCQDTHVHF